MKKPPLLILTGPTAVGKTALSIALAKRLNGEIISADSMQVYRGMNIGSAKITEEETCGIPHYLIDVLEPEEEFDVVKFKKMAKAAMDEIYAKGKLPIVVGGTGFYIQALLKEVDFTETDADTAFRDEMYQLAKEQGVDALFEKLREVDPESTKTIHPNNVKRVIRALEFYHQTNTPISAHNKQEQQRTSPYTFGYFVLTDHREKLYERIDKRVDQMLEQGLLTEVEALKKRGLHKDMVSMKGLGYKELLSYLDGGCTLDEAVFELKKDTRHFAKRQLTWFKREKEVHWFPKWEYDYDEEKILQAMLDTWKGINYDTSAATPLI